MSMYAIAAAGIISVAALSMGKLAMVSADTAQHELKVRAGQVLDEALVRVRTGLTDDDADGYAEAQPGVLWGSGPAGGGKLPVGVVPTTDPWGTPLGYCVWDNGTVVSAGRIAGTTGIDRNAYAVISAGPDRVFQTACSSLATSKQRAGDDGVRAISQDAVLVGFGEKYFGDPVLTAAELPASAADGAQRLVLADRSTYIYRSATGVWMPQPGIPVNPVGPAAVYGAAANGGMPMTVSLSTTMMSVVADNGQVAYAGAVTTGNTTTTIVVGTQALTLRPTGMLGMAARAAMDLWNGTTSASFSCPQVLGLDGRIYTTANGVLCTSGNYTAAAVTGIRSLVASTGSYALSSAGTVKSYAGVDAAGLPVGSVVDADSSGGGIAYLTNQNMLVPPAGIASKASVRAFSVSSYNASNTAAPYARTIQAIDTAGSLWCAGANIAGECGTGSTATAIGWTNTLANVRGVSTGYNCSVAVTNAGRLYSAGACANAYLSSTASWVADATFTDVIAAWLAPNSAAWNIVIQRSNGTLWGKGQNTYGQLGVGDSQQHNTWTQIL